jgi:hypothetical protein
MSETMDFVYLTKAQLLNIKSSMAEAVSDYGHYMTYRLAVPKNDDADTHYTLIRTPKSKNDALADFERVVSLCERGILPYENLVLIGEADEEPYGEGMMFMMAAYKKHGADGKMEISSPELKDLEANAEWEKEVEFDDNRQATLLVSNALRKEKMRAKNGGAIESEDVTFSGIVYQLDHVAKTASVRKVASSIRDLKLPDRVSGYPVVSIMKTAFLNSGITNFVGGKELIKIEPEAFAVSRSLMAVCLVADDVAIGIHAFDSCLALKTVILPKKMRSLSADRFPEIKKLPMFFAFDRGFKFTPCRRGDFYEKCTAEVEDFADHVAFYSEKPIRDGKHWHYDASGENPMIW